MIGFTYSGPQFEITAILGFARSDEYQILEVNIEQGPGFVRVRSILCLIRRTRRQDTD